MEKLINKLIVAIVLLTASFAYATEPVGVFNADVYCTPTFAIDDDNGNPGTPVLVGNYFSQPYYQSYSTFAGTLEFKQMTWRLIGPRKTIGGTDFIKYYVTKSISTTVVTSSTPIETAVGCATWWNMQSDGWSPSEYTGDINVKQVKLLQNSGGTEGCDDGYATFQISAFQIHIDANTPPGHWEWTFNLTATVDL